MIASGCSDDNGSSEVEDVDISMYINKSRDFQNRGQFQAAIIEARNAIQTAPEAMEGYLRLSELLVDIGQARQAITTLESIEPRTVESSLLLAKAYLHSGKIRSARDLLASDIFDAHESATYAV
ncbi:MAG: hypothetical protein MI865_05300, partial [Proteobacteria bacterium]|nr:hypothetical protein [Pseudomonadota bacterium]